MLPDGTLVALAGDEGITLREGDYRWHLVRVHHRERLRLALDELGRVVDHVVCGICAVALVALLAGGVLLLLSLLPPGCVHL